MNARTIPCPYCDGKSPCDSCEGRGYHRVSRPAKRQIVRRLVTQDSVNAKKLAKDWRADGFSVRIFQRDVRAGGAVISVLAVVAYRKPEEVTA